MNTKKTDFKKVLKRIPFISFLVVIIFPLSSQNTNSFNRWTNISQEVTTTPADNYLAEYAISGNTIHTLWLEFKYNEIGNIYYRRSTNGGDTWENPILIFDLVEKVNVDIRLGYSTMLSVDGNNVHIAFADYEYNNNGTGKLHYVRSTNGGASFDEPIEIANTNGGYIKINYVNIKASGNNIAIAYSTEKASEKGIHLAFSANNGDTFIDTLAVPYSSYSSTLADFVYDGQTMVFMHEYTYYSNGLANGKVYATVSNDNGANFTTTKISTPRAEDNTDRSRTFCLSKSGYYEYINKVSLNGNYIHFVFEEIITGGSAIKYVRSTDGGNSFEEPINVNSQHVSYQQITPTITSKGDNVYIAYYVNGLGIYFNASQDNGGSFSEPIYPYTNRDPYYVDKAITYRLLADPNDETGATIHLIGDRNTLLSSTDSGNTFDYFLTSGNKYLASGFMGTQLLIGDNGTKHFFNTYRYKSDTNFDIYYHRIGTEPEPAEENHCLNIVEENNNREDNVVLSIPHNPTLKVDSALTIELWFRMNSYTNLPVTPLILKNKTGHFYYNDPKGFQIAINVNETNKTAEISAGIETTNGKFFQIVPEKINDTLWHHIAITYNENGGLDNFKIYVDGIPKKTLTASGSIDAGDATIYLGSNVASNNYAFDYKIDELRLWTKALTREELRENMHTKDFLTDKNLKLYLNFDTTLKDISGNGNDAIAMGIINMEKSLLNPPHADFDIYKVLNQVSLNDKTENGSVTKWYYGNNVTSTIPNPQYTYSNPGEYEITMTAANSNSVSSTSKSVSIEGLDRISPTKAGNRNYLTLDVFGGALSATNTSILLRKEGETNIVGEKILEINPGNLQAKFLMDNAPLGLWDVVVIKGGVEQVLEKIFTVEEAKKPIPWVNISGRNAVLKSRFNTFTINYGNNGNVDAYAVPLWIFVTNNKDLQVGFLDFEMELPEHLANHENAILIQDTVGEYFIADTIDGLPMNVRIYPLMVPVIRANTSGSYKLQIKTADDFEIKAMINGAWIEDIAKNKEGKSNGTKATLSQAECMAEILGRGVIDATVGLIPAAGCLNSGFKMFSNVRGYFGSSGKISGWNTLWNLGLEAVNCGTSLVSDLAFPIKAGLFIVNMASTAYDMTQCLEPRGDDEKDVRTATSFDPNEMIGPNGFGDDNWMQPIAEVPYAIFFENQSSATAPAHEVYIIDTLDAEKFDLTNFSFGDFGWGDSIFVQENNNLKEFSKQVDLRPELNTIVRISGRLDIENAVIVWDFISLDPNTMEYHEDPDLGFLPPNNENGIGEGFVSFTVGLKPINATGNFITNKATIIFDENAPIQTNEYINTFDITSPNSMVINAQVIDNDSILVSWSGLDQGSGIKNYTIWMQKNDGEAVPLFMKTTEENAKFKGELGAIYKFYSVAVDNVFMDEETPENFDFQFAFESIEGIVNKENWKVYPNPAGENLFIKCNNLQANDNFKIQLIDVLGKIYFTANLNSFEIQNGIELPINKLAAGLYLLRITNRTQSLTEKINIKR